MKVSHKVELKKTPEFGAALKTIRQDKALTLKEVSDKLGITPMGLSHYEKGARTPNVEKLDKWAQILGYEVEINIVPLKL